MMTQIETILAGKGIYFLTLLLLTLGLYGIIVSRNYMKKLICMNIMPLLCSEEFRNHSGGDETHRSCGRVH